METFFNSLKKTLIATIFVMFGLVATYVPQTWNDNNNIGTVMAAKATLGMQVVALVEQAATAANTSGILIQTTLSAGYNAITSWATNALWTKEYILDGIAWSLAKTMISSMTNDMVSWAQSGFTGNTPAFVTDLQSFLTNAGDLSISNYLSDPLEGPDSYLCEPFKNDIKQAVVEQYTLDRVDQNVPTACDLGVFNNDFETFVSGSQGSFGQDGWLDFLTIVTNPDVYTPYGSYLATQASVDTKVAKSKAEESAILDFGNGFKSLKVCDTVNTALGNIVNCSITSPGKLLQEALSFNLDSGRQALVAADELDEILGQLLTQLAGEVFMGATGLLGLGSNSGTTGTGYDATTYTPTTGSTGNAANQSAAINPQNTKTSLEIKQQTDMEVELKTQESYLTNAIDYRAQLIAINYNTWSTNYSNANPFGTALPYTNSYYNTAKINAINQANQVIAKITADITTLEGYINNYDSSTATAAQRAAIWNSYQTLKPTLYDSTDFAVDMANWSPLVNVN